MQSPKKRDPNEPQFGLTLQDWLCHKHWPPSLRRRWIFLFVIGLFLFRQYSSTSSVVHCIEKPRDLYDDVSRQQSKSVLGFSSEEMHRVPLLNLSASPDLKCGMNWSDFIALQDSWKRLYQMTVNEVLGESSSGTTAEAWNSSSVEYKQDKLSNLVPLLWTVSGGKNYSKYLPMLLDRWERLGMYPTLVMAVDSYTADLVCSHNPNNVKQVGHFAILWDQPKESYSRVTDVKFEVPAVMVDAGIPSFFIEPDIFCRRSPLSVFQREIAFNSSDDQVIGYQPNNRSLHGNQPFDLIHTGHSSTNWYPNIGAYWVLPNPQVARFFRNTRQVLRYSKGGMRFSSTLHGNDTIGFFDQAVYHLCLPERSYERGGRLQQHMYQNQTDFDLVQLCQRKETQFRYKGISSEIVGYAPQITDNTHCIHPIMGRPGLPFEAKLLMARYYGFEPDNDVWDGREKFLHFYGGDLTTAPCYDRAFARKMLVGNNTYTFRIQYQLSALIALGIRTNRTVVLPRNVRTREGAAVQLPILVSVLSIEKLVKYRFEIPKPLLDSKDGMPRYGVESIFMAQDGFSWNDTVRAVQEVHLTAAPVLGIDKACLMVKEEDYEAVTNIPPRNEVLSVMNQINWCIGKRKINFHESVLAPFDRYCENFYTVSVPGVTW